MTQNGKLEAIWIKRARRGPMDPVSQAYAIEDRGLKGNANQGGHRQITIIEKEVFEELQEQWKEEVKPVYRRANLMVSGIRLRESRGRILKIGDLSLKVMGETRPCERMDEAVDGLREALEPEWRGGVYGKALNDALIRVEDPVRWIQED